MGCCCAPTCAFFIHPITWQQLVTLRPGQEALLKVKPDIRTRWCTTGFKQAWVCCVCAEMLCVFFFFSIFSPKPLRFLAPCWVSEAPGRQAFPSTSLHRFGRVGFGFGLILQRNKEKKQLFTEKETKYFSHPNDWSWYIAQPAVLLSWSCYHSNHCSFPLFLFFYLLLYWTGSRKLTRDLLRAWGGGI